MKFFQVYLSVANYKHLIHILFSPPCRGGLGSSVGIVTGYGLDGPGIQSWCGRDFLPPSLLYNGYQLFSGGEERLGRDADPSLPSSVVVMKG